MLTELRYQVKIHTISKQPRKKNPANSPQFFFYYYLFKTNKTCNMEMTSYAKVRSHLCTLDDANTEKQSLDLLFLSSPINTCKVL
jgi:hypothetical protein